MKALQHFLRITDSKTGQYLSELLERGVLTPLNGKAETFPDGTIFVPCSDGHRFGDIYHHHSERCFNGSEMQMPLASPGGAMLAAGNEAIELMRPYSQHNIFWDIRKSIGFKSCPTVILYTHVPCALARELKMGIPAVLELHRQADINVRNHLRDNGHNCATVISCFHIDFAKLDGDHLNYPDDLRFRTYEFHPLRFM